jgi:hypothetical protein
MSKEAICDAFLQHLNDKDLGGLSYGEFWRTLRAKGLRVRGRSDKNERDVIYQALSSDSRIEKVRPGFFAPRPQGQ